jgi:hypothetical protein
MIAIMITLKLMSPLVSIKRTRCDKSDKHFESCCEPERSLKPNAEAFFFVLRLSSTVLFGLDCYRQKERKLKQMKPEMTRDFCLILCLEILRLSQKKGHKITLLCSLACYL